MPPLSLPSMLKPVVSPQPQRLEENRKWNQGALPERQTETVAKIVREKPKLVADHPKWSLKQWFLQSLKNLIQFKSISPVSWSPRSPDGTAWKFPCYWNTFGKSQFERLKVKAPSRWLWTSLKLSDNCNDMCWPWEKLLRGEKTNTDGRRRRRYQPYQINNIIDMSLSIMEALTQDFQYISQFLCC